MTMFGELYQREQDLARHQENRGRLATVNARFRTTGWGSVEFEERIDFGLTFVELPFVAYGSEFDPDDIREELDRIARSNRRSEMGEDADVELPAASGFVTSWERDAHGFYIGAWVGARVEFPQSYPSDAEFELFHHFSFNAVGIKTLGLNDAT